DFGFTSRYCSRVFYENVSTESISEVCNLCFTVQKQDAGSDIKLMMRDFVKRRRSSAGF
ncbi:hypothetical protein SUGI_1134270, partial [Cryptomeria japonica]